MRNETAFAAWLGAAALALSAAGCSPGEPANGARDGAADLAALRALDTQLANLEADVQHMNVYEAIWENELEYTRGLDRHDEDLERGVFWREASISYGTRVEFDELPTWANASHANSAAHQHHVTGLTLDVDGDTAHEEGYILFSSDMRRDKTKDTLGVPTPGRVEQGSQATLGTGRYVNRYERRNGDWRMIVHEYVNDISMRLEAVDLCATACFGRWDRSDISYARPLQPVTEAERAMRAEESRAPRSRPSPEAE
jgi:hypothetical protein